MLFIVILLVIICFLGAFVKSDEKSRDRFRLIYTFIGKYEEKTGIRLTTDQAIALIQVTVKTMRRDPVDKIYLDERYLDAQKVVDMLCADAENKVLRKK